MSKKFQLQIPEPCHENWDKMTPVDKGRFCDSCQKAVVDFTGMSDSQLVVFFKKPSTGSVCGRFFNDQLARDIEMPGKRLPLLKYFFQFTIPVFLTTLKSQAQENKLLKTKLIPETSVTCTRDVVIAGNVFYPRESKNMIGIVTDENGMGVPYASVFLKGTNRGTTCDSSGSFKIEVPISEKKVTFIASCVGYLEKEKEINNRKIDFVEIKLTTNAALNGEVVVTAMGITRKSTILGYGTIVVKKKSYLKRIKECFIKDSVNIFPNPAKAGNEIRIEWKRADRGIYNIDLFNLQGQLIHSTASDILFEKNIVTYRLPMITAGSYILRLTNKNTGKKYTEKIIIQ
jgi:hypothetical protein